MILHYCAFSTLGESTALIYFYVICLRTWSVIRNALILLNFDPFQLRKLKLYIRHELSNYRIFRRKIPSQCNFFVPQCLPNYSNWTNRRYILYNALAVRKLIDIIIPYILSFRDIIYQSEFYIWSSNSFEILFHIQSVSETDDTNKTPYNISDI